MKTQLHTGARLTSLRHSTQATGTINDNSAGDRVYQLSERSLKGLEQRAWTLLDKTQSPKRGDGHACYLQQHGEYPLWNDTQYNNDGGLVAKGALAEVIFTPLPEPGDGARGRGERDSGRNPHLGDPCALDIGLSAAKTVGEGSAGLLTKGQDATTGGRKQGHETNSTEHEISLAGERLVPNEGVAAPTSSSGGPAADIVSLPPRSIDHCQTCAEKGGSHGLYISVCGSAFDKLVGITDAPAGASGSVTGLTLSGDLTQEWLDLRFANGFAEDPVVKTLLRRANQIKLELQRRCSLYSS